MTSTNLFLLAADNPSQLLQILQQSPSLASSQDDHGYSLLHAAASYNHSELLRKLVNEFHVNVNLKDEDGETALFVVETLDCARILIEELHADITIRGYEGKTAVEKIQEDDEFPEVTAYLIKKGLENNMQGLSATEVPDHAQLPRPPPDGLSINLDTIIPEDVGEVVDQELKRRIEELASREDFNSEDGQGALKQLITDALRYEKA